MAIRSALGAARSRIIRQLLTESVVLSVIGGLLGLALGAAGVRALLAVNPGGIPRIGPNGSGVAACTALAFTLSISLLTGVLFGLAPAIFAARADLNVVLKDAGARSGGGTKQNRMRSVLVVIEMALAIVLLVGAGLLIRTFAALHSVSPGFDAHNVLYDVDIAQRRTLRSDCRDRRPRTPSHRADRSFAGRAGCGGELLSAA